MFNIHLTVNSLAEKYWKAVDSEKMNRSELEKAISPLAGMLLFVF